MKVGIISVGFPNFRYDYAEQYLKESLKHLKNDNYEILCNEKTYIQEEDINQEIDRLNNNNIDLLILQCGTYSYGSIIMKIFETLKSTPLILMGFTEPIIEGFDSLALNSLCAINMYSSFLVKVNKKYSYYYGAVNDNTMYEKIVKNLLIFKIKLQLNQSKFCIIGGRVPGFYLSNVDEIRLKYEIGPTLSYYSLAELYQDMEHISESNITQEIETMKQESKIITCKEADLVSTAKMYLAIMEYQKKHKMDGFAIKCWPEFQSVKGFSPCLCISRLNNHGVMTSCEGDVTSLITQYIQYQITKKPCFLADLVNLNPNGTFKAWHCGPAPISLAREPEQVKYTQHPTMKEYGPAVDFSLPLSTVTVIKLSEGAEKYKMFIAKGKSVIEDRNMKANQSDILFDSSQDNILETIMSSGIEHHYIIVYQDIVDELIELCNQLQIEAIIC